MYMLEKVGKRVLREKVGNEDRELESWCYESEEYVVIYIQKHMVGFI